ncbi:hypothetical protein J2Z82_000295 [Virgibacillus litoralis]|uniref:Uncharacterized protein n=1 Tax=Virgibacillus litoralis TaxID=578221 RepID=A0ABS4HA97_9BACI|nr:hypothetical protein [Virgibacillus litoralis]
MQKYINKDGGFIMQNNILTNNEVIYNKSLLTTPKKRNDITKSIMTGGASV